MNNNLTIIMYHYVRDLKNSQYPEIKGLDLTDFKEQMLFLKRHYNVVSMEEVINCIDNGTQLSGNPALLTFDDAYLDHYENVFPILKQHGLKGSFYIPAKAICENTVLDVNKIHFILAAVKDKLEIIKDLKVLIEQFRDPYQLKNYEYYYKKIDKTSRYDTKEVIFIKRLLQVELDEEPRKKMTDILFEKYIGIDESEFSRSLYMNTEHLRQMIQSGMHIGCHGYNHYWWNRLNHKDMANELDSSVQFLEKLGVNMDMWTACYPYGSYDNQSISMLADRGCKLAVTTDVGIAKMEKASQYKMPRMDTNDIPKDRNATFNT